ncbi:MAG: helix-turn-helix domain-containing protein [Clostridia bacterium]|nr:helix-turn-helix domain-containing protein [Clostridia bacterium]
MPKLLTVEDLTKELGISRTTAYQIARQIKHSKVGRRILIAEEDLLEYLAQNTQFQQDNTKNQ